MILDSDGPYEAGVGDEAGDASGDVDPRHFVQDANSYDALAASELASRPMKPIDTSGPWYDILSGMALPRLFQTHQDRG